MNGTERIILFHDYCVYLNEYVYCVYLPCLHLFVYFYWVLYYLFLLIMASCL